MDHPFPSCADDASLATRGPSDEHLIAARGSACGQGLEDQGAQRRQVEAANSNSPDSGYHRPGSAGDEPGVPKLRVARRAHNDAFERAYLLAALDATNQNVTRAAKLAGVSRQQIQRLMIKHRVRRGETSPPSPESPETFPPV